ncbi:hypothetical protein S83_039881 [Arachis hypogaea]
MSMNTSCSGSSPSGGGGGGSSSGGGSSGGGGPCGACKFLRRKCVPGCIFAPYFDSEQGATHFAAVHKVFGASNVSKLLMNIPVHKRLDAVVTICYEAQARLRDPVYGCVAHIFALQQQIVNLQAELSYLQGYLATLELPHPPQPPPTPPQPTLAPPTLSITDLPPPPPTPASTATVPATYDLSSLFEPMAQTSWAMHNRPIDAPRQFFSSGTSSLQSSGSGRDGGDLQTLAHELLRRHGVDPTTPVACSSAPSSSQSHSK